MNIDITSMFFNSRIEGQTATPAWGTSIGQSKSRECRIDDMRKEVINIVVGMTYRSVSDYEKLNISKGSPDREILLCSVFDRVFINNTIIDGGKYCLLLVREHSKSHDGRLIISYAPYITYNGIANQDCINLMQNALGVSPQGCWFVYDISIVNQSDLYFNAVVVDADKPKIYSKNTTSRFRSDEWRSLVPEREYTEIHRVLHADEISKDYLSYLTALRTKPFMLLAGISGTGKSRIVRELAFKSCPKYLQDKDGTTPGNYCMIEVKPNWHDSTELIGYYSNLSQSYQFKKFVKFLVKAQMNPDVPFFVCLDEMNLAPVEQYFAEILSILETRKHPKKDGEPDMTIIKTEVVVDSKYFRPTWKDADNAIHEKVISDANWYREFFAVEKGSAEEEQILKYQESYILRDEGLRLPDNLFIIGTVNMDDTTHQFSRKVIDRAMTIEMNGGKLANMFGGSKDLEYLPVEDQQTWQQAFRQHYVTADEVLEEHAEVTEELRKTLPARLDAINKVLKGTPFEVSYRVLNELTIMVGVMLDDKKEEDTLDNIINRAVDNILLMKILPRIEGDAEMFAISSEYKKENEIPYDNRLEWLMALAPDIMATKTAEAGGEAPTSEDVNHATARGKIKEMIDRLDNQEFTRFWP